MTESEEIFESVLKMKGIIYERIPRTNMLTPDYKVKLDCTDSYWEIKELDINKNEKEILKNIEASLIKGYSIDSFRRVAKKIKKASNQFKVYGVVSYPCVLVIYDSRPFAVMDFGFVDSVLTKMYGNAEYEENLKGEFIEVNRSIGLLTNKHKHISAIAFLSKKKKDLIFYHNKNTSNLIQENQSISKFENHYIFERTRKGWEWIKHAQLT